MKANHPTARRSSNHAERAGRILDAAAALILHYGFDKTTVDDIAREAGVSKGTIYLHWSKKDDLFESLIWRELWAYADEVEAAIVADPQGGTLQSIYRHTLLALTRRPMLRAVYNRDLRILGDYLKRRSSDFFNQRQIMNGQFIRAFQTLGLIRQDIDPEVLQHLMNSQGYGLINIQDSVRPDETPPPTERILEMYIEMITRYLTPETPGDIEGGKRMILEVFRAFRAMYTAGPPQKERNT